MSHQTFWKEPVSAKVVRAKKRIEREQAEDAIMAKVRRQDGYCRFPLCGCKKHALRLDVCHARHRGAGGNPALDRTTPEGLILLCAARHRENLVALDRGTIRISPLTAAGWRGPCLWEVETVAVLAVRLIGPTIQRSLDWMHLATETAPHVFEPFTPLQQAILEALREMTL